MKSAAESLLLVAALLLVEPAKATRYTSPGKPKLTSCRSPEKETFTCWWKPGHDGGLSTAYALYYRKENSEVVYECPDYHTAGENSCFFNKNDTSIWVNYNITVVATNALGSNFSDPVDVDVVYIVQPHTPENVTATVTEDKGGTFLKVSWEPPHKADTRSGWITLIYELRVKLEGEEEWEEHRAGQQKTFNVFGLRSGGTYLVQLRCKPDHGFWSEWSSTTYVKVPDHTPQERSLWILIAVFAALVFLILTWLLNVKSQSVKHCLLPPVPGPKIKGFDNELLKNGRPEEVFNALVVTGFPPTSFTDYEDFMVEYLEINGQDEQELILEGNKEGIPKCKSSPSDNDSGRGSCDSRTLFVEKCGEGEVKEEGADKEAGRRGEKERRRHQTVWEEEGGSHVRGEAVGPDAPHGRVKTWPSLFPSPPERRGPLGATRQLCLSDGSFRPSAVASDPDPSGYGAEENTDPKPGCREFHRGGKQPRRPPLQTQLRRQVSHSDCDIPGTGRAGAVRFPRSQFTEYVEVHKVSQENVLVLQPLSSGHGHTEGHGHVPHGEDYSKVREVSDGNMLLLQRAVDVRAEELGQCQCENWERSGLTESCYTTSPAQVTGKPSVCLPTTTPLQGEMVLAANGYVDTANVLPTY